MSLVKQLNKKTQRLSIRLLFWYWKTVEAWTWQSEYHLKKKSEVLRLSQLE